MQDIITLLRASETDLPIIEIAARLKKDRHTVAKNLESMRLQGLVEYREIGKSKVWKLSKVPFVATLQNNTSIATQFKTIIDNLDNLDGSVTIQDPARKIIWANYKSNGLKCYEHHAKESSPCKNCPVEKTFRTGKPARAQMQWKHGSKEVITQPIKDNNNKTVAVVEIIKDKKKK